MQDGVQPTLIVQIDQEQHQQHRVDDRLRGSTDLIGESGESRIQEGHTDRCHEVSFIFTLAIGVISLWNNARIDILSFVPKIENDFRNKLYKLRRYSVEAVAAYNTELNDLSDKLEKAYKEKGEAETILRNEYEKLNEYSADISNL